MSFFLSRAVYMGFNSGSLGAGLLSLTGSTLMSGIGLAGSPGLPEPTSLQALPLGLT